MKNFAYSKEKIKELKSFISYLQKNDVKVTLILSPYHPKFYRNDKKANILEIENWYREFSERKGIRIIGAYNGYNVGCGLNDYDGMHPNTSCNKNYF